MLPLYAERNSAEQRIGTEGLAAGTKKEKSLKAIHVHGVS